MTMSARDEGEFELILGNRQILLVFFILVLLLGLFFAMGFLVGRSVGGRQAASAQQPPAQVPISVDATKSPSREVVAAPAAAETQQTASPEQAAPAEPAPKKAESAPKQAQVPGKLFVEQPPAGTYLQAAATQRADAETMLSYLISKTGLSGYVTPSPKSPELCRVLIGPLSGNEQIAEARARLNAVGVTNAFLVKY